MYGCLVAGVILGRRMACLGVSPGARRRFTKRSFYLRLFHHHRSPFASFNGLNVTQMGSAAGGSKNL